MHTWKKNDDRTQPIRLFEKKGFSETSISDIVESVVGDEGNVLLLLYEQRAVANGYSSSLYRRVA